MSILIQQVDTGGGNIQDVLIRDGVIVEVGEDIDASDVETVVPPVRDYPLLLLPAAIDVHVHSRFPGGEEKEDLGTFTAAAFAGGVTTVCDMPNTNPPIIDVAGLNTKIAQVAEVTNLDLRCYIGATESNLEEIVAADGTACGVKVYYGTSTGALTMNNPEQLQAIFESGIQMPVVIHAEDDAIIAEHTEKLQSYEGIDIHGKVRPPEAATSALKTVLALAEGTPVNLHITHVTTAEEVAMIHEAKQRGMNVTADVTPHHLVFDADDIQEQGHMLRVNPPIRTHADTQALWNGLRDGVIDMIASDHAPHTHAEKTADDYWNVPSGVPGVQTLYQTALDRVDDEVRYEQVIDWVVRNPARRFGMSRSGEVLVGEQAELVLVDPQTPQPITTDWLESKCGWSPWEGREFRHSIVMTIHEGEVVYEQNG